MPRYQGRGLRVRWKQRRGRRRATRAEKSARERPSAHWWDAVEFLMDLDVVLVIVAIVLLAVFGLPLLFALFDVTFVVIATIVGVVSRVLFKRPWTIEARSPSGLVETEQVVGWQPSRAGMKRLEFRVRTGRL